MFDTILKRVPWVVAAVMVLAVTGQAALAGTDDGITPAAPGINAGTVDRLHAVKSTGNTNKRARKLMAFAASGYLPTNIVQGGVATVAALQSPTGAVNEADNLVHWNQLLGVPPAVVAGDTTVSVLFTTSPVIAPGGTGALVVVHPVSMDVETTLVPVASGGFFVLTPFAPDVLGEWFVRDGANLAQFLLFKNAGTVASAVHLRATVWNAGYVSPAAVKRQIEVTFYKKLPKKYRP